MDHRRRYFAVINIYINVFAYDRQHLSRISGGRKTAVRLCRHRRRFSSLCVRKRATQVKCRPQSFAASLHLGHAWQIGIPAAKTLIILGERTSLYNLIETQKEWEDLPQESLPGSVGTEQCYGLSKATRYASCNEMCHSWTDTPLDTHGVLDLIICHF